MLSKTTFNEGMAVMCEIFERQPTELLLKAYYAVLRTMTDAEFNNAVQRVISTKRFNKLPLPAEILQPDKQDIDSQSLLAYETFRRGKERTGIYDSVIFEDGIIHAVVQAMGGWQQVCLITEEDWQFRRREFLDTYKAFLQHPPREIPEKLIGLVEQDNHNRGFEERIPQPKVIGTEPERKQIEHEVTA